MSQTATFERQDTSRQCIITSGDLEHRLKGTLYLINTKHNYGQYKHNQRASDFWQGEKAFNKIKAINCTKINNLRDLPPFLDKISCNIITSHLGDQEPPVFRRRAKLK